MDVEEKQREIHKNQTEVSQEPKLSQNADDQKTQTEPSQEPKLSQNADDSKESAILDQGNVKTTKMEDEKEISNENIKEDEKSSLPILPSNLKETEKGECSSLLSSSSSPKSPSFMKDENGSLSDMKDYEKKALVGLRSKLEEAILNNKLFKEEVKDLLEEEKEDKGKSKVEEVISTQKDITLWGVPLLPSKGDKGTDELLKKFLRAREYKVEEAFEMFQKTLEWRKENKMDSILEEDFGNDYDSMSYMKGLDREGHLICYNVYGVFDNDEVYNKTFATEASRDRFLRWRLQLMEKQIQMLDFSNGKSLLLQINDLKNAPGPSRKDLRLATRQAVEILQDNYPEFVARNIFINVPFWYYAFNALLSPFLTQRAKSKFVFSRPSRVTETLLKYISIEEIPMKYGGLQREDDLYFSTKDMAFEATVKAGATETIDIHAPEAGLTFIWDLTIIGWDVNYKEEFVPDDEKSYTLIVKKGRKISWQDESIRNTFTNKEPGKLVITVENGIFRKKKVLYRYKAFYNTSASSSSNGG